MPTAGTVEAMGSEEPGCRPSATPPPGRWRSRPRRRTTPRTSHRATRRWCEARSGAGRPRAPAPRCRTRSAGPHAPCGIDAGRQAHSRAAEHAVASLDGPKRDHLGVDGVDAAPVAGGHREQVDVVRGVGHSQAGEVAVVADRRSEPARRGDERTLRPRAGHGGLARYRMMLEVGRGRGAVGPERDAHVLVAQGIELHRGDPGRHELDVELHGEGRPAGGVGGEVLGAHQGCPLVPHDHGHVLCGGHANPALQRVVDRLELPRRGQRQSAERGVGAHGGNAHGVGARFVGGQPNRACTLYEQPHREGGADDPGTRSSAPCSVQRELERRVDEVHHEGDAGEPCHRRDLQQRCVVELGVRGRPPASELGAHVLRPLADHHERGEDRDDPSVPPGREAVLQDPTDRAEGDHRDREEQPDGDAERRRHGNRQRVGDDLERRERHGDDAGAEDCDGRCEARPLASECEQRHPRDPGQRVEAPAKLRGGDQGNAEQEPHRRVSIDPTEQ